MVKPRMIACAARQVSELFRPRPWWNPGSNTGYQAYATPPLTPEQQIQRCNTGRLIGGLGGGAVAYAMSRDDGRAWAIPLGALLGSQVGCNAAADRGPLPLVARHISAVRFM